MTAPKAATQKPGQQAGILQRGAVLSRNYIQRCRIENPIPSVTFNRRGMVSVDQLVLYMVDERTGRTLGSVTLRQAFELNPNQFEWSQVHTAQQAAASTSTGTQTARAAKASAGNKARAAAASGSQSEE